MFTIRKTNEKAILIGYDALFYASSNIPLFYYNFTYNLTGVMLLTGLLWDWGDAPLAIVQDWGDAPLAILWDWGDAPLATLQDWGNAPFAILWDWGNAPLATLRYWEVDPPPKFLQDVHQGNLIVLLLNYEDG
jgi:hypothetical protein